MPPCASFTRPLKVPVVTFCASVEGGYASAIRVRHTNARWRHLIWFSPGNDLIIISHVRVDSCAPFERRNHQQVRWPPCRNHIGSLIAGSSARDSAENRGGASRSRPASSCVNKENKSRIAEDRRAASR